MSSKILGKIYDYADNRPSVCFNLTLKESSKAMLAYKGDENEFDLQFAKVLNRACNAPFFESLFEILYCVAKTKKTGLAEAMVNYLKNGGLTLTMLSKLKIPSFSYYDGAHAIGLEKEKRCYWNASEYLTIPVFFNLFCGM